MPALLDRRRTGRDAPLQGDLRKAGARKLEIGLVNNMPDAALESTERQFVALLDASAQDLVVHLTLLALPEVPRSDTARAHLGGRYANASDLRGQRFDGLIVTGTEPVAASLRDEPYWEALTRLID